MNQKAQHPKKWSTYQELTDTQDQKAFFATVKTLSVREHYRSTLPVKQWSHEISNQQKMVDVIIRSILFGTDDVSGIMVIQALSIFEPIKEVHDHLNENKTLNRDQ